MFRSERFDNSVKGTTKDLTFDLLIALNGNYMTLKISLRSKILEPKVPNNHMFFWKPETND